MTHYPPYTLLTTTHSTLLISILTSSPSALSPHFHHHHHYHHHYHYHDRLFLHFFTHFHSHFPSIKPPCYSLQRLIAYQTCACSLNSCIQLASVKVVQQRNSGDFISVANYYFRLKVDVIVYACSVSYDIIYTLKPRLSPSGLNVLLQLYCVILFCLGSDCEIFFFLLLFCRYLPCNLMFSSFTLIYCLILSPPSPSLHIHTPS